MNATRAIVLTLTALVAVALPLAAQQPQQIVICRIPERCP